MSLLAIIQVIVGSSLPRLSESWAFRLSSLSVGFGGVESLVFIVKVADYDVLWGSWAIIKVHEHQFIVSHSRFVESLALWDWCYSGGVALGVVLPPVHQSQSG